MPNMAMLIELRDAANEYIKLMGGGVAPESPEAEQAWLRLSMAISNL